MYVDTGENLPVCQKPYTLPLKHYSWVQQEIEILECVGVIKKSISPWASPIVVVPKKSAPGEAPRWRMCVDFQKINELQPKTQRVDKQTDTQGNLSLIPLPKIEEMYANLCGAKIFTTLDLQSGYYHIALDDESKTKTAFVTPFGKYEFNAVPFGLTQAPAYFQQLISIVFQDCSDLAMAYLDDIIIFSQNKEEHLKHIKIIFKKLNLADLKLKESKCYFFKKEIHYLGHLILASGIQPLHKKLDSIRNMAKPRSPKEIKQFLGLTSYYRKFVPRFFDMARPLTKLLAHSCEFEWTEQCDIFFQILKDTLCSAPILKYPDTSKLYMLYTDASKYGWAGVLTQSHMSIIDGQETTMDHPMSYVSGLFHGSQLNWAALTKEAYAIYMSIKKSTFYLTGHETTLRSDHLPLKKFLRKMTLNNMVNNWSTKIESFNIYFLHISGKANVLADTLSRLIDTDQGPEATSRAGRSWVQQVLFWNSPKGKRIYKSHKNRWWYGQGMWNTNHVWQSRKFGIIGWITTRWGEIHISTRERPKDLGSSWQSKRRSIYSILFCQYALTAVCMLTGYTFCTPIKIKSAEEIVMAWRNHIAFPFGVCRKLPTDNGTEWFVFQSHRAALSWKKNLFTSIQTTIKW